MQKFLLISILFTLISGCKSQSLPVSMNNPTSTVAVKLTIVSPTITKPSPIPSPALEQPPTNPPTKITGKEIFKALKLFSSEYSEKASEGLLKALENEKYEQIHLDDYIICWGMLPADNSFISIFKLQDSEIQPLSFEFVGEQIDSVKVLEDKIGEAGIRVIEVKGYGASGSSQTGIVHLFAINGVKVNEVWNHVFFSRDTNGKNITTISKSYFSILPAKYYNGLNNFSITVLESTQKLYGDDKGNIITFGKEEISSKITQYLWNEEEKIFKLKV